MRILILINLLLFCTICTGRDSTCNFITIEPDDTPEQIIKKAANVRPSERQYEWQKLELTGFIHFGVNTFEEVEWGRQGIDISKFNPTEIDVNQWISVFKNGGFKLIILTAKHHDGFCLWPSKYTEFDIASTPFQNGHGDIVRDLSAACREAGIKFGIYLSPWDMNESSYGTDAYNTYFKNQLTELLSNYGEIAEVWFDGACGEGPNGKRQVYHWHSYYKIIRRLQPNAVIAVSGPDVRWVGTESGYGRQTEWSVLPGSNLNQDKIAAYSQQEALDGAFTPRDLMDEDLGSRHKIQNAKSLVWYPAEIDASIRPGWFYHESEDNLVKSPFKLVDIYYNSVGLNGVLLLNIPPDKRGLITEHDIKSMHGMRYILDQTFSDNLAKTGIASATDEKNGNEAQLILNDDLTTFWTTNSGTEAAEIIIELAQKQTFNRAMLQENILDGQRIEKFHLDWWDGSQWQFLAKATTVGYKRLLRFLTVTTDKVRISIDAARTNPTLASFGLYEAPPVVSLEPDGGTFMDSINFKLISDSPGATIYYSLDGKQPDKNAAIYSGEVTLYKSTQVKSYAISVSGKKGLPMAKIFNKAKYGITLKTQYSEKYDAGGKFALVDGAIGSQNFKDGKWQGYQGKDLQAVIDLGTIRPVGGITVRCLSAIKSYIFLPASVEFAFSEDGKKYTGTLKIENQIHEQEKRPFIHAFEIKHLKTAARYVRITAKNIGVCPEWHPGAGTKAWLFVDEIMVE